MKRVKQIVMMAFASLLAQCVWAAAPLVYSQYLTTSYVDTGWTVASADDLASRSFAGIMAGGNINSGNPLPSTGYYVTKQSDGTVTFEMQVKNNELKAILVRMQIVDGKVQIKGEMAGYRANNAQNPIGTRCFTADGTGRADGTSSANLGTSQTAGNSYACGAVDEVLSWSNASYVGQTGYSVNQGAYGPFRLLIPATTELPLGSTLRIKEISLARRDNYTDQKNVISVGPANDANVASDVNSIDTTNLLGGKTRIRYPFSKNVTVVVGTEYPNYLLNQAGGGATGNTMNIHVITPIADGSDILKQTNNSPTYCAIYEVKAEVVSIFTPDPSHDEDVSFVTPNAPTKALKATVTADNTAFGANQDYARLVDGKIAQIVNVTGSSAADTAMIFGGTAKNAEGAVNADIWMNVIGGTYGAIFGGSNCDNWSGARQSTIKGNVVLEVGGTTTANNVLGGFYKDGLGPTLNGNINVVIKDQAVVKGVIAGAGMSAHNNNAAYTGDVKVTVKNVQSDNTAGALISADSSDYIVGGGVYGTNANSKENITGNTSVVIDLPSDATGSFVKNIVGGGFIPTGGVSRQTPECKVSGNTSVSITAPAAVTFSGDIYAGGYLAGTSSGVVTVGGTASVTLNGGTYTGSIKSGTATGAKTLNVTDDITIKPNNKEISGFGSMTIANGKTLTIATTGDTAMSLAVPGAGAIAKTGTGVLTLNNLPSGANYAVTVSEGSLDLRGNADGLNIVMNSEGGSLDVDTSRPIVNVIAGLVHITAKPEELVAGSLTLTVPQDAAEASKDKVKVYDSERNEVEILSVTKEGTTVTIALKTLPSINASTTISALNLAENAAGLIIVEGAATEADAFTVTFDAALPAGVSMEINGFVKFASANEIEIPYNKMSFGQDATLIFDSINGYTIPAGASVIAGTASGTIVNNGTLTINGTSTFTLTNTGTLNIAGGVSTVTRGGDQAIKGTVNIAYGAEFVNKSGDAVSYGDTPSIFNVRGTLTMADNTRWTVGGTSKINLYGGCTVTGAKTGNGAFDLFHNGEIITVNRGADTTISAVTIDAKIRARNGSADNASEINIAEGMTLAVTGGFCYADRTARVKRTGAGHFTGTIPLSDVTLIYSTGSVNNIPAHFVVSGTSTIEWHGNGSDPVCSNDSKTDPFITVNPNATLNIYGHDFSGWNGALRTTGWIVNNGTLVFENGAGTRFWREHIVFGNGATMKIDNGTKKLLNYGGAGTADACQYMLPEGTASIVVGTEGAGAEFHLGNDDTGTSPGGYGTKGVGIMVGDDAVLTIETTVGSVQGDPLTKFGNGTLVLTNEDSSYAGSVTLKAGSIKSAISLTVTTDVEGKMVVGDGSEEAPYALATIVAKIGTTPYASVQDAINALTEEQTVADIVIVDATAEIPTGYAKVTTGDVVTLRQAGDIYWKLSDADWTSNTAFATSEGGTDSTLMIIGDTIHFTSNVKVFPVSTLGALDIVVKDGTTLKIGHEGTGTHDNIPTGSTVTIGENAKVLFTWWDNDNSQSANLTLGNVKIDGSGTWGITDNGAHSLSAGDITGTAKLVVGENDTIILKSTETTPISGVEHKHVVTTTVEGGVQYSLAIDQVTITVPSVDHTTVEVTGGTLVGNTVTVDYGTEVTITYSAADGYMMTPTSVTLTATETKTIDVPEGTTPQLIVATVNGTPYASLAAAKAACTGTETIVIVSNLEGQTYFARSSDYTNVGAIEIASEVTVKGYFQDTGKTIPLVINGTFEITNGFTNPGNSATIPTLSGEGSITRTWGSTPTIYVENHAGIWTGTVDGCVHLSVAKSAEAYYYDANAIITALRAGTEVTNIGYTAQTVPAGLAIEGDKLVLATYTIELKTFDHTVCYAKINTGDEAEYTEALTVKYGDAVYFRYVAAEGYRITSTTTNFQFTNIHQNISGGSYTIETELDTVTITIPTVANMQIAVTDGNGMGIQLQGESTIVVTIGSTFTVTYTPAEGYCGDPISTTYTDASAETQVVAPTEPPVQAVAKIGTTLYPTLAAAFAVGGEVTLLQDTIETLTVAAGKTVTLDINGKVVKSQSNTITVKGTLVVNNTAVNGAIRSVTSGKSAITTSGSGTFTINGGTIDAVGTAAVSGVGTITGGTITSSGSFAVYANSSSGSIVITGGTITGTAAKGDVGVYTGNVKVTGATLANGIKFASNASGIILAGTDEALIPAEADVSVYDGETLVGYAFSASSNGLYYSFADGKVCKLVKDISHQVIIYASTTLDLNGHDITVTDKDTAILVKAGSSASKIRTATIIGEGTVSCDNGAACNAVRVERYADLTIAGGTYVVATDKTDPVNPDNATIYIINSYKTAPTKVTITGGTFEAKGSGKYTLNILDSLMTAEAIPTITVSGGTFVKFDPAGNNDATVADGYISIAEGANYVVAKKGAAVDPTPTTDGVAITIPVGGATVEVDGETTSTIPNSTGKHTVVIKDSTGKVIRADEIGVVNVEKTTVSTTHAVAVPFKGKTVATLLNTALLAEDDTLMAWIGGKYEVWKLSADKKWIAQTTYAKSGNHTAPDATTTALKCGQAVWVTTAGQIVTFGDVNATGDTVELEEGHNLLGNTSLEDATPTVAETEDQVQLIGEVDAKGNEIITRYNKTSTGWQSKIQKRIDVGNGVSYVKEDISNEAPTVKPGRGYWLIRPESK